MERKQTLKITKVGGLAHMNKFNIEDWAPKAP